MLIGSNAKINNGKQFIYKPYTIFKRKLPIIDQISTICQNIIRYNIYYHIGWWKIIVYPNIWHFARYIFINLHIFYSIGSYTVIKKIIKVIDEKIPILMMVSDGTFL